MAGDETTLRRDPPPGVSGGFESDDFDLHLEIEEALNGSNSVLWSLWNVHPTVTNFRPLLVLPTMLPSLE